MLLTCCFCLFCAIFIITQLFQLNSKTTKKLDSAVSSWVLVYSNHVFSRRLSRNQYHIASNNYALIFVKLMHMNPFVLFNYIILKSTSILFYHCQMDCDIIQSHLIIRPSYAYSHLYRMPQYQRDKGELHVPLSFEIFF